VPDDSQGSQNQSKSDLIPAPAPSDAKASESDTGNPPSPDLAKADATPLPATMPTAATGDNAPANASSNNSDWNKLLAEGSSSPTMMSETPSLDTKRAAAGPDASGSATADQPASDAMATNPPGPNAPADKATPDFAVDTAGTPSTQPTQSAQRTHIVQPGEMLTSISAAVYGDSRKWKKIAAANPNINPNRLAPGTKLVIPALSSGSSESSAATVTATAAATAALDPQTQYQVQPNDSLYRISMKLYGKADHVDKLYQDNKETIGSDPRRLKLNMVLKLSDPPTSNLTTASR
jgi:nucleoid-associated protein YgaU